MSNIRKTRVLASTDDLVIDMTASTPLDSIYAMLLIFKELNPNPTKDQLSSLAVAVGLPEATLTEAFDDLANEELSALEHADMDDVISEGDTLTNTLGLDEDVLEDNPQQLVASDELELAADDNAWVEMAENGPFGDEQGDPLKDALNLDAPVDMTELHPDQEVMIELEEEDAEQDAGGE